MSNKTKNSINKIDRNIMTKNTETNTVGTDKKTMCTNLASMKTSCKNIIVNKTKNDVKELIVNDEENDCIDIENNSIMETLLSLTGQKNEKLILNEFVYFIYTNTHCLGGKHKGILYKELPNIWSQRKNFTEDEKKYECTGEWHDDCTVEEDINKYIPGNVNLVWKFNKIKKDGTLNLEIYDSWKMMNIPRVLGFMKHFSTMGKNVFLNKTINITNYSGSSEDHRGSNHCLIDLPVDTNITLTNPTLEEFIEALWMIKYKKFDTNYEMCVGSKISIKKNILTIDVNFDNGS